MREWKSTYSKVETEALGTVFGFVKPKKNIKQTDFLSFNLYFINTPITAIKMITRYHFGDLACTQKSLRKYFVDIKDFLGLCSERNVLHLIVRKVG